MNEIPIIIIKDAWAGIKSQQSSSRMLRHVLNPNNHRQGWLTKHTTAQLYLLLTTNDY